MDDRGEMKYLESKWVHIQIRAEILKLCLTIIRLPLRVLATHACMW